VEELEIAEDVGFYFRGLGLGVEVLEFGDDLLDGVIAVAALDDFEAGAVETKGSFGHEEDALLVVFAEANAGGEAGLGVGIRCHEQEHGNRNSKIEERNSSSQSIASERFGFGDEGPGRRPAGVDVSEVEGVKHGPEDIAFRAKGGVGRVLLLARTGVLHNPS